MQKNVKIYITLREKALLFVCLLLIPAIFWLKQKNMPVLQGEDHMPEAKVVLRVAAPPHEWFVSSFNVYGQGFEQDLLNLFTTRTGIAWAWKETKNWEEAWAMLRDGRADAIPSLGSLPDASYPENVVQGPAYATTRGLIVHSAKRYGVRRDTDMCRFPILTPANSKIYEAMLLDLTELSCEPQMLFKGEPKVLPVLDSLLSGQVRFALIDEQRFALWQPFYLGVKPTRSFMPELKYRWYWRKDNPLLAVALDDFWGNITKENTLDSMYDKYFGFFPKEADPFELRHFQNVLRTRLPLYEKIILTAAKKYEIDPLLLIALIYQESQFDTRAQSKTGVRGLMQITSATARQLQIDREDPHESIMGGTRYLRSIYDSLESMKLDEHTRWIFAMAGYNRGPAHLRDAVSLAKHLGGTGKNWPEVKDAFLKLQKRRWYSQVKYGYTNGSEVVHYIQNIRYYHYILNGLLVLSRPEGQNLATFSIRGSTG